MSFSWFFVKERSKMCDNKKIQNLDIYLLLEVSHKATKEEIKNAYHMKALKCHPDKNPDNPKATQEFQTLLNAYTILSDDDKRRAYDIKKNIRKPETAREKKEREREMRRQWEEAQRKRWEEYDRKMKEREEARKARWRLWSKTGKLRKPKVVTID